MKRDLRDYAKKTDRRLIVGALLLLFIGGGALIWWRYGAGAAGMGIACLLAGLVPVALILILLWLMDWILQRARPK